MASRPPMRAKGLVIKLLGSRGASAVMGIFMLALGSSEAVAQDYSGAVPAAVMALDVNKTTKPLGILASPAANLVRNAAATTTAVTLGNGQVVQAQPARSVTVSLSPSVATEAAWLYRAGWPLYALADRYSTGAPLNEEADCLAKAVYFESRGESLDGQLAVARVVMNRAASGKYPTSWCGVVKQPWQFSFVRNGVLPTPDQGSQAWGRAQGIARLAMANVIPSVSSDVLWYHATYVAPSWGRRLSRAQQIGAHIFYRA